MIVIGLDNVDTESIFVYGGPYLEINENESRLDKIKIIDVAKWRQNKKNEAISSFTVNKEIYEINQHRIIHLIVASNSQQKQKLRKKFP